MNSPSSASVMTSTTSFQTYPSSRPRRRSKRAVEGTEPGQKPRKVNSEIRKQQNRIASRNYREKRKRKLQYLQQFLQDQGPTDQQGLQASETTNELRMRSISAEYHAQEPTTNLATFSPNSNFSSLSSSSSGVTNPTHRTSTTYDSHSLQTPQLFSNLESTWNTPLYEYPPPKVNISNWNAPHWMPDINFNPQTVSEPEDFQFTPLPTQQVFPQLPAPPQQHQEIAQNADLFTLGSYGHYRGPEGQLQGISNCMTGQTPFNPDKSSVYI